MDERYCLEQRPIDEVKCNHQSPCAGWSVGKWNEVRFFFVDALVTYICGSFVHSILLYIKCFVRDCAMLTKCRVVWLAYCSVTMMIVTVIETYDV